MVGVGLVVALRGDHPVKSSIFYLGPLPQPPLHLRDIKSLAGGESVLLLLPLLPLFLLVALLAVLQACGGRAGGPPYNFFAC